ncbi:MAG: hypothetical protein IKS10_08475 [Lachnospiraceae bacterium]|nr:hypothetical protein [Lachnospiraceae bacterium]
MTKNPALTELRCTGNQLYKLDTSKCPELKTLECEKNELISLDLEQNTKLEGLWCDEDIMQLDVSHCPNLITLGVNVDTVVIGAYEDMTIVSNEDEEP